MTDVTDRVMKLVALTASPNEHEASNAAVAACRLIREHRLVFSDLTEREMREALFSREMRKMREESFAREEEEKRVRDAERKAKRKADAAASKAVPT